MLKLKDLFTNPRLSCQQSLLLPFDAVASLVGDIVFVVVATVGNHN